MNVQRLENFKKAILRLNEAVTNFNIDTKNSFSRDALIQRFEVTFELAWKCLADYLIMQGMVMENRFPRQVIKLAFSGNLIKDEAVWLKILQSRNLMSHIYDETVADAIAGDIANQYAVVISDLLEILKK